MKNKHNPAKKRFVRRSISQLFASLMKRQHLHCQKEVANIVEMLRELKESIDIIAREIARQVKRGE